VPHRLERRARKPGRHARVPADAGGGVRSRDGWSDEPLDDTQVLSYPLSPQLPWLAMPSQTSRAPAPAAPGVRRHAGLQGRPPTSEPERRPVRQFLRAHWLITVLIVAALIVRLIVALAYPPGFYIPDSFAYVSSAVRLQLYDVRPFGYSFLLILLEPAHSVLVVTSVQHVIGVATGLEVYVLLRRQKLPYWGCALAAVPPLFSALGLQIEHLVASDTLFAFLVTTTVLLLLWQPRPRIWMCAIVGLLLACAVIDRSQGMLLLAPGLLYLAVARMGLRSFVLGALAMTMACLIPVGAYAWWFHRDYGEYDLTSSTGAFLYARVATFAECSIVKPPADERWLCLSTPLSKREPSTWYVWASQSPTQHGPGASYEFNNRADSLETNFALRAIMAQPADYLKLVWSGTVEAFLPLRDTNYSASQYQFPGTRPESAAALAKANDCIYSDILGYNGGVNPSTRVIQPFAGWLQVYQRFVGVPGPLLGLIVVVGLVGIVLAWRRFGGPGLLLWLTGLILIVTPAATADFDARYTVAALPALCAACALGVMEINGPWVGATASRLRAAGRTAIAARSSRSGE
jgi:hypothetical protein